MSDGSEMFAKAVLGAGDDQFRAEGSRQAPLVAGCTVVVCTHQRPKELNRCLQALTQQDYRPYEILVVDNAPEDGQTHEVVDAWGVRYLVEPIKGLNRARNSGARAAIHDIVAYLDDDCVPEPNWLAALLPEFRDPRVMVVTGRICGLSVETEAERMFEIMGGKFDPLPCERRVVDKDLDCWFELTNFGGVGNGANMAFRRRVFEMWPGFDVRLGPGCLLERGDENLAFFSLAELGCRFVYTPQAIVRHPFPRTFDNLRERYVSSLTWWTAYATLLFCEYPRYRYRVVKYVMEALYGKRRSWRRKANVPLPRVVPLWRAVLAMLRGPMVYARLRLSR